jgi:protein phosphatase
MITVHGVSNVGHVRTTNEDAMIWDLEIGLVAVADGMGGHQAGEVASRIALDSILSFMQKSAATDDVTWPFGINPDLSVSANRLLTALRIGNLKVFQCSEEAPDYAGMGTTVVAILVDGETVTYASVGDSRLYAFANGRLRQLTRDDSWVMMLSEESGASLETLRRHPMRNVLTNVVGARPELEVGSGEVVLGGNTLMLCTDGLHGALPEATMASILSRQADLKTAADALIAAALEVDGKDNLTVVLVKNERQ